MSRLLGSRRSWVVLSALVVVLLVFPSLAFADSPHFLSAGASINSAGQLVVSFKEAGLGNTVTSTAITLTANGTAEYACINGGSNHPKASNKATVDGPVSATGQFPVRNGETTGSIVGDPPRPGSFTCPSGQSLVLASVSYSNIVLTGEAGDQITIAGPISKTLVNLQ